MAKSAKLLRHEAPGISVAWLGQSSVHAFGDGMLLIGGEPLRVHQGGLLSFVPCPSAEAVFSCGDDGRIVRTSAAREIEVIHDFKGKWLDCIAISPTNGSLAVASGRSVLRITPDGLAQELKPAKAPTGIAFSCDGETLAVTHSGGVSLFEYGDSLPYQEIACSGGPISACFSLDGQFLFVGLSEPALAGWRLSDGKAFRMGGYPGKPKSLALDQSGHALLTSGGPALLVWPLDPEKGPMGQSAGVYRPRLGLVSAVACHQGTAAVGWSDGGVDIVNLSTGQSRHMAGPAPRREIVDDPRRYLKAICSLAFNVDGSKLAAIGEDGSFHTIQVRLK
jgi:WD40 repeat protein